MNLYSVKRFSFCLLFTLIYLGVHAQSTPCFFQRDTGTVYGEISQSVVELNDGSTYVTGIQNNGPIGNDDVGLLKFDACGNVLWVKYYGDTLANDGTFINKTHDGNLVVIGQTQIDNDTTAVFLYKLDTAGAVLFKRQYINSINQSVKYVKETWDKGFILCGYIAVSGANNSYVLKTDSVGNVQWQQMIGGSSNKYAQYIYETSDTNFIMVGDVSTPHNGVDVEVVKINRNGNIIWDKTYGDNLNNGSQGIIELSTGQYLFFGETGVPNSVAFDFFIQKIDTAGNDLVRHVFGGTATDALFSLVETTGLNFICTGYSASYNGGSSDDVVIFKIDSTGQIKWLKNIFNPGADIGYEIKPSAFGGYLVTGLYAKNNNNYFLTRSDTIGNTSAGINDFENKSDVVFYPNPASNEITVQASNPLGNIYIYNTLGELVWQSQTKKLQKQLDISILPPGIYILETQKLRNKLIIR